MRRMVASIAGLLCVLLAAIEAPAGEAATISAAELEKRLSESRAGITVLDVRTPEEFAAGHVPGARNIPVAELGVRVGELGALKASDIVVYCRSGRRTEIALGILGSQGFRRLHHLEGDMQGWSASGRPVERTTPPPDVRPAG